MPWHAAEEDGKVYKYQYHPHGDTSQPLRNAPSAMNTVIVPKVTLPEVWTIFLHKNILDVLAEHKGGSTDTMLGPSRALQQARQGGVGLLDAQRSLGIELELKLKLGQFLMSTNVTRITGKRYSLGMGFFA